MLFHVTMNPPPACLAPLVACTLLSSLAKADQLEIADVFVGGQDGYPAYRIPTLITTQRGSLLAFAEGRAALSDHAKNDIVLKRSTDGGKTWGPLQIVDQRGDDALNNPTAVLVRETGRVLLMYQRYASGFDEHNAEQGYEGSHVCRTLVTVSDDDGRTWAAPVEVTRDVKRPTGVTSTASGPGIGIQLLRGEQAGRILIPFNQGPYGEWKAYAVISDDGGRSWRYGDTAPEGSSGHANEVQFVELNDGFVMLNARNQGGEKLRKIAVSRDGGETWSATRTDPALIEPECQASLLRHPGAADPAMDVLLFSNPASPSRRTNGTVRLSRDHGKTWPFARVLYPGSFAYSCLASLPDRSVGCLFERDRYSKISFTSFTMDWLTSGPRSEVR
jgi:sialidase-1